MSTPNHLRQRLRDGQTTFGAWIQIASPAVAEILANEPFDWIAIDCEHGLIDLKDVATLVAAIDARGIPALVRLPTCDGTWIRRVLDAGASGIIIPMVNTPDQAREGVSWARYPPLGRRGFGFSRANGYGARFDPYVAAANDRIVVIAQIENIHAVHNIDAILEVDGLDGTLIGPYDLSGSMGLPGQTRHPDVLAQCDRVLKACETRGKPAGIHVVSADPAAASPFLHKGFRFIALGMDTLFLRQGAAAALSAVRAIP